MLLSMIVFVDVVNLTEQTINRLLVDKIVDIDKEEIIEVIDFCKKNYYLSIILPLFWVVQVTLV